MKRGAGIEPGSAGVAPVTTWTMTISRPRVQNESSATRMAADVDGLPSMGTMMRLQVVDGAHAGTHDEQHAPGILQQLERHVTQAGALV